MSEASTGPHWPSRQEGQRLLVRLGLSERDLRAVMEQYPDGSTPPSWWPQLCGSRDRLVASMGRPGKVELLLPGTPDLGAVEPFFGIYVLLSALPDVLGWHARHGIPAETSWATLRDLGRQVGIYWRFHGHSGFDEFDWLSRHFRGLVFQIGRLQFERSSLEEEWKSERELTSAAGDGGRALAVHIPEGGPLSPHLCDEALAEAPEFFRRHFPDEDYRVATCDSWLLDEQLAEYLPPGANIVHFQRRFQALPGRTNGNRTVLRFVFYRHEAVLDELPQSTALQRAIVQHRMAGRDWFVRAGWLRLPSSAPGPDRAHPDRPGPENEGDERPGMTHD